MNYTKGKWAVRRKPVVNTLFTWVTSIQIFPWNSVAITGTKTIICRVFGGTKANCEANAQLIAAASEMYEALKEIAQYINTDCGQIALATIKKAEL